MGMPEVGLWLDGRTSWGELVEGAWARRQVGSPRPAPLCLCARARLLRLVGGEGEGEGEGV
eukprot:1976343-Prymnesium_polylepis.1